MLTPQFTLDIHRELVVDLFAGGGGASTGIEQAIGRHVDIAVNHDREAVALHQANHPQTRHYVSDVFEVDPLEVTEGRPVGLLWASPDCTFHSKARGGKPHRDRNKARRRRGLAGVVIRWADAARPRVILMENVEEFQHWGPLLDDGMPCPERRGTSFARWVARLRNLGYQVEWRERRACDAGAPTIRKRLFIIARCDGQPIVWPAPTHGAPDSLPVQQRKLKPWRPAAECIDWSIPCPSIFERVKPLADATCRRIAKGIMRYVIEAAEPFILTNTTGHRGAKTSEPLRTITTGGHHALVTAFLAKHYTGVVGSDLRDPIGTVTSVDHHSLVTSHIVKLRGDNVGAAATGPLHTISAQGLHHGEVRAFLVKLHTISAQGLHHGEVRAFLVKYYGSEQDGISVDEPLHTIPTHDRFGLVMVHGEPYAIVDIGLRMLTPRELYRAQGFPETFRISEGVDPFTGARVPLTKTAQVRMCGNSVSPHEARALAAANYTEQAVVLEAAA